MKPTLFIAIVAMFSIDGSAYGATICLRITDQTGGTINRATVKAMENAAANQMISGPSDENGRLCLEHVPDGEFMLEVSAPGFMRSTYFPVVVDSPKDIFLPVQLLVRMPNLQTAMYVGNDAIVYGTVKDGDRLAVALKLCFFESSKKEPTQCTQSNDVGQYEVVIKPGQYRVELSGEKVPSATRELSVPQPGYYRNKISLPLGKR